MVFWLGLVSSLWLSFVLSPSIQCLFYGTGSKLGHNILGLAEYMCCTFYSFLLLTRLTNCNTFTCRRKNTSKVRIIQEHFGSYLLSIQLYNTLGMKFLSSFGGKTKSCFLGRRE